MSFEHESPISTPAGWYLDPANPLLRRWWDGSTWTNNVTTGDTAQQEQDLAALNYGRFTYTYGMTWWAHVLWALVTLGTFGVGLVGWIGWAMFRRHNPRKTGLVQ